MINSNYFLSTYLISCILQNIIFQFFLRRVMNPNHGIYGYDDLIYYFISIVFFLVTLLTSYLIGWGVYDYKNKKI
jgi:hypothetical protein